MSKQQYLKALNREINKLNGIIDTKIMHNSDYRKEAARHRELLRQIRREQRNRTIFSFFSPFSRA